MRTSISLISLIFPVLAFSTSLRDAQNGINSSSFLQDYIGALTSSGFTGFANVVSRLNGTQQGQNLFSQLASGNNYTAFTPTDQALQNLSPEVANNDTKFVEYLTYHYVPGDFQNTSFTNTSSGGVGGGGGASSSASSSTGTSTSASATSSSVLSLFERFFRRQSNSTANPQPFSGVWPNVTLGRTLLNSSDLVQLEGNKSQVLAWTRSGENGNVTILNQANGTSSSQNITVVNTTIWRNLFFNGINGTLIPPGNLSTALTAVNASGATNLLNTVQLPSSNGTNDTALNVLEGARGITILFPNNDAFTSDVNQTLQGLQNNQTAQQALLQNHYINGTSLYSTQMSNNTNVTSAAGELLQFFSNETGLFVNGTNGTSAQITRPDVLLNNGVAHIINRVLVIEQSNTSAASSAFASATSEAAISSIESGPIGGIGGGASSTSSGSASSTTSSGSQRVTLSATTSS